MTLDHGNYGIFLILGNAGSISSIAGGSLTTLIWIQLRRLYLRVAWSLKLPSWVWNRARCMRALSVAFALVLEAHYPSVIYFGPKVPV